jgi:hypothetical protein
MGSTSTLLEVAIRDVWKALGGGPLRKGRGVAFWRPGADGYNVSLDNEKGIWYDHAAAEGGGILGLIEQARGCDRRAAIVWLAGFGGIELSNRLSTAERRAYHRQVAVAERVATDAALWRDGSIALHEEHQRAAVETEQQCEPGALELVAASARRLYTLRTEPPAALVRMFLTARREDPESVRMAIAHAHASEQYSRDLTERIVDLISRL